MTTSRLQALASPIAAFRKVTPIRSNNQAQYSEPEYSQVVLSTTSYAVLGMLAIRPWSAYELTKQMRRSLAYCWPKAESVLYDEPKRLVRLGLATAHEEPVGDGARTRVGYAITPAGRTALRQWLATEPAPPRFELEPLLRLLYADQAGKDDALQAVASARAWARTEAERGLAQLEEYRADGGPFPQRLHITVLFAELCARLIEAVEGWAEEADAEIESWPRTKGLGATPATRRRLQDLIERSRRLLARIEAPS
jgi:PadR family transcriptional regulator, regulatory protein AphA